MKILKIFGLVVGIHVFALILIFANPGCSSTAKPAPAPAETAAKPEAAPMVSAPAVAAPPAVTPAGSIYSSTTDTSSATPLTFNPEAPAGAPPASGGGPRIMPTRPGTPVAGVLVAEPEMGVTPTTTYTVKSGDNLSTIARKHGLTTAQLSAANGLTTKSVLQPGKKLKIPAKPAPTSSGSTPAVKLNDSSSAARAPSEGMKHTVRSGETLGGIARKYGVRQGDLAEINSISDPAKIRPGMELAIPGWKSPAGKSGKAATNAAPATPTITTPTLVEPPASTSAPTPTPPASVPVIQIAEPKQP